MNPSIEKASPEEVIPVGFNADKQHTIRSAVTISGTGLHTGIMADLTLKPANAGFGLQFQRTNLIPYISSAPHFADATTDRS